MNDLLEKMKDDFETFCCSAQRFMDAVREQNTPKAETPDYNSWIGKVVYVWSSYMDHKIAHRQKSMTYNNLDVRQNCNLAIYGVRKWLQKSNIQHTALW